LTDKANNNMKIKRGENAKPQNKGASDDDDDEE